MAPVHGMSPGLMSSYWAGSTPIWRRSAAFGIDLLLAYLLFFFAGGLLKSSGMAGVVVAAAAFWLYKPISEGTTGSTVGKWMFNCCVVTAETSGPVGLGQAFLRNAMLVGPLLPFAAVALLNPRNRGLHDLVAGTRVMDT